MEVDSETVFTESSGNIIESIQRCFDPKEGCSVEEKIQALALLGSVDFGLEALERQILTEQLAPEIFSGLLGDHEALAQETAVCLKNLMTNENAGLGNKCTRRLYALRLFPVLNSVMEKLISTPASPVFVEAIAVQVLCIASAIPASLPQITASPLVRLFVSLPEGEIIARCAVLQAILVAVEDNLQMAQELTSQCPNLVAFDASQALLSTLRILVAIQCARLCPAFKVDVASITTFLTSLLTSPLPEAKLLESEPASFKSFFEIIELAAEALELLLAVSANQVGKVLKTDKNVINALFNVPFQFLTLWTTEFAANFGEESNIERVRLVRRLWTIIGSLFTLQEQLMLQCRIVPVANFVEHLMHVLNAGLAIPSADYCIADEVSGWLRARLTIWGDSDYPSLPAEFFAAFKNLFMASESPVVLSNTCAMIALLIPYAPETVQAEFCVYLNAALCTEPFDVDHLEVLLSAVDAITGIFDPQSKEWPAKSLSELKADAIGASERLTQATSLADEQMKREISERVKELKSLIRILWNRTNKQKILKTLGLFDAIIGLPHCHRVSFD